MPSWGRGSLAYYQVKIRMFGIGKDWVVVSNIFYFHPYLGRISNLTNIFQMGWNHQLEKSLLSFYKSKKKSFQLVFLAPFLAPFLAHFNELM